MRSSAFPNCCGALNFYEFSTPPIGSTEKQIQDWWNRQSDWMKGNTKDIPGIALCILTEAQKNLGWDAFLKDHGWLRVVRGFWNKNHNSNLTLYMYENHPEKRNPPRKK